MNPRNLAVRAELADTRNWIDEFAAAPPHVSAALGLAVSQRGDLAMVRSRIPFSHFNMVLTLGCPASADEGAFDAIEAFYGPLGGKHWVMVVDPCEPADLGEHLSARGYRSAGAWDRVILHGARPDLWAPRAGGCEFVGPDNQGDWSAFILRCYGMPPLIADWLHSLVGREEWIHALHRAADGSVVMARSLYLDDEWAWLGIDAPIPGVMAPCFDDDQRVTAALLLAAAERGAQNFVSDIEVPDPKRQGPAYERWGELGFEAVYLRRLYVKG